MDTIWALTILANLFLMGLLMLHRWSAYLPCLTLLVGFNVITAPAMWYAYVYYPEIYRAFYYHKPIALMVLWFAVTLEAFFVHRPQIAVPVEIYAFLKLFVLVGHHAGLVQSVYWVNQGMRLFNLGAILFWIWMFYPKEQSHEP